MKNKLLLFCFFIFFLPLISSATHIVGGSLTYEQIGGSTYRITLKLYRDCKSGNAAFPGTADIEITKNNGTAVTTVSIPFTTASLVPPNIDTCATNPGICLEEAIYTKIVTGLPPSAGGYHLNFQYCCRNNSLLNIVNPLNAGETWYAHIPDNGEVISNSSPKWVNPPPVFVCQGNNMSINHSATDADGDSLVYSLYTPYDGDTGPGPKDPTYPGGVFTVPLVTWSSTYGANNPLNPSVPNSLTISSSGIINGVPPTIGQFVVGVRCREWRNGILIGEILRDFQMNVVNCPPVAVAGFTSQGACNGLTISFTNTTTPAATGYFWNFGNGATLSDTSHAINPSYTYPSLGNYTAMLIINKGTACADTFSQAVNVSFIVTDFTSTSPGCKGFPINFTDGTTVNPATTVTGWNWDFGDGNTSTAQNPSHPYNAGGTYTVTLISSSAAGCKDTMVHTVSIQGTPVANAGNDTISCSNNPSVALAGTVLNAGGGMWNGSGVFNPNNFVLNATYTPSAAAIANGADTVLLITTSNALCPADTDQVIISFYAGPSVNAGTDLFICKDNDSIPICATITVASGGVWQTTGSGTIVDPLLSCTYYLPSSADTAAGSVILYNSTTGNGNCLASIDSITITFTPLHIIDVKVIDSICAGTPIHLFASSTTNSGIWTSGGSGTFLPNNTTLPNSLYNPSTADNTSGNVSLYFTSTNNTGCKALKDTVNVILIPAPTPAFTSISACPFASVAFTDASVSIGPIISWSWNFGDATTSSIQNPTHVYSASGPYTVSLSVTSINGCVNTAQQIINVYYKPIADFWSDGICLGSGTSFLDSSTVNGATISSWNWSFGDATTGTAQNPIHVYAAGGNYLATLIVHSSQGCIDTVSQTVNVLAGPTAGFTADDYSATLFQNVHFSDQSAGAVSWIWNFGDSSVDSSATVQNPTHVYNKGGFYDVCLYATDASGCTDTLCKTEIVSSPPTVPSGFSPNGDGQNDVFYVYGGPFKKLFFRIYNNWGELIFESDNQAKGWDGKRNGVDQAIGVYVYTVVGITEDDEEHTLSGDVTLLR